MKQILAVLGFLWAIQISAAGAADQPRSIIYFIGDGMGMEYLAAYRHFADDPATPQVETSWFDRHLVGTASTHPLDPDEVTDSAASATALASGIKTYNGAVGVDASREPVETLLERAKRRGYQTALVVTSQINHATPASFAAHVESRKQYNEIADQYLDRRFNGRPWVDILIGGGRKYFEREERNLVHGFQALGYEYADNFTELMQLSSAPALALLADKGLPYAIDQAPHNRLEMMTTKALELLSEERPFFMLVEASQIDWCGHENDIACVMAEMADAEQSLKQISDFIATRPNTLLLATADHSTGGLSMGFDGQYQWRAEVVRRVRASAPAIARKLMAAEDQWRETWQALTAIDLDEQTAAEGQQLLDQIARAETGKERRLAIAGLERAIRRAIDRASQTGWTTHGHTGGDVAVMALGAGAENFAGHQDNTDLARQLFAFLP